jgi:DNA repair protein RecO (recombination protein O)
VITQAEVIRAYGTPQVSDDPKYTAGTAMLETAERFTPVEKEPAIRQFLLLIGGLRALGDAMDPGAPAADGDAGEPGGPGLPPDPGDRGDGGVPDDPDGWGGAGEPEDDEEAAEAPRDPRMVLDAYFLRSLTFAGYAPALEECARCGSRDKNLVAFAVSAGGMVCAGCRPPGSASPAPRTVALMVALLRGEWDEAMRSERRHRVECSGLVAAYLQWHLEHSIRSLRHVERA